MKLDTVAGVYTALLVARKHGFSAVNLKDATNKKGEKNAFIMQDVASSALLVADNEAFERLYTRMGQEVPSELQENMLKTKESFGSHWDQGSRSFVGRLPQNGELLAQVGGPESLLALHANSALTPSQRGAVLHAIKSRTTENQYPVPTNNGELYDPAAHDRGAVSPTFNLLIANSIKEFANLGPLRRQIAARTGSLAVDGQVFARGYHAETGEPLGQHWGPSAAAVIALAAK